MYIPVCKTLNDWLVKPFCHEKLVDKNLEDASSGRFLITGIILEYREAVIDEIHFLYEPKHVDNLYYAMSKNINADKREKMGIVVRKHKEDVFLKKKLLQKQLEH